MDTQSTIGEEILIELFNDTNTWEKNAACNIFVLVPIISILRFKAIFI